MDKNHNKKGGRPRKKNTPLREYWRKQKEKKVKVQCLIILGTLFISLMVASNIFYVKSVAKGTSMNPTIHEGDVLLQNRFWTLPQVNEIICFQKNESVSVAHRVISIDGDVLSTKGDNNKFPDDPISLSDVYGVYADLAPSWFIYSDYVLIFGAVFCFCLAILVSLDNEQETSNFEE